MQAMKPKQLPMVNRRFEQIFHREHRHCSCEMPMVSKKWNDALGTFVAIRLCCMAKLIEKVAQAVGVEALAIYEVFEFDPKWVWDCDELHQKDNDGTVEMVRRGPPPRWLRERMERKGISIPNLPKENS